MPWVFDDKQAERVLTRLTQAWQRREKGFSGITLPEIELMPPEAQKDELLRSRILFWWAFISQNGSKTREVMEKAVPIFMENSWLIGDRSKKAKYHVSDFDILDIFLPYGKKKKDQLKGYWMKNLETLHKEYGNDPRQIFLRAEPTSLGLKAWKAEFDGFGPKTGGLAAIWHQEQEWNENGGRWSEISQVPIALGDIWVLRQIYMFGILKEWETDHHTEAAEAITQYIESIVPKLSISHIDMVQSGWCLGSYICRKRTGAMYQKRCWQYCFGRCPAHDFCRCFVPASTYQIDGKMRWEQNELRRNHLAYTRPVS